VNGVGALLGAAFGLGLWMVVARLVRSARPSLESRVAPYIRDVATADLRWSPRLPSDRPSSALAALALPPLRDAAERLERLLGGQASVRRRLARAGSGQTLEQFRLSQVAWALTAFSVTILVGLLGPALHPGRALPWLLLSAGAAIGGILARDYTLTAQVRRREQRILAEFPTVAELLALAVAAGEGPVAAIDRVVNSCRGALTDELAVVLGESRTGVPVATALEAMAARSGLPVVARFAEGFAVALERGTPLVDVLTAQAGDVREASRRALIETGARKEVAMMVPVVFLIMPVTLLFAFFPGVVGLELLAP
jgi:tight adherence protein C